MPSTATIRTITTGEPVECHLCDADLKTAEIHSCAECGKGLCSEHAIKCAVCGENFHCAEHGYPTLNLHDDIECRACYDAELDDAAMDILASPMWGRAEAVNEPDYEALAEVA